MGWWRFETALYSVWLVVRRLAFFRFATGAYNYLKFTDRFDDPV